VHAELSSSIGKVHVCLALAHPSSSIERSGEPLREFKIVRMVFVVRRKRGKTPGVFHSDRSRSCYLPGQRRPWPKISNVRSSYGESRLEIFPRAGVTGGSPP